MKKKILVLAIAVALIAVAAIGGSLAWLTSTDEEENTFTVGNVKIDLTELKWTDDSKLVPGTTIAKDPTVTVKADSEKCYVRLLVTVNNKSELDTIFAPTGADLTSIFDGYDSEVWVANGSTEDNVKNTQTYEFRYHKTVASATTDTVLEALFDSITVPEEITGEQLATLNGFEINVVAQAIQAENMTDANDAWDNF